MSKDQNSVPMHNYTAASTIVDWQTDRQTEWLHRVGSPHAQAGINTLGTRTSINFQRSRLFVMPSEAQHRWQLTRKLQTQMCHFIQCRMRIVLDILDCIYQSRYRQYIYSKSAWNILQIRFLDQSVQCLVSTLMAIWDLYVEIKLFFCTLYDLYYQYHYICLFG